jgi:2-polyprenyl-3-methyl-5-hydroxy-6-metoxy-1,4-benzoquinol methylase
MPHKLPTAIEKTLSLYYGIGWKTYFAKLRFWYAPFVKVEQLLPQKGSITDLGCAEGLMANYAALKSRYRKVTGIEVDEKRLLEADHKLPNTAFKQGDITKIALPKSDAFILFHVLHHLPSLSSQEDVLKKIYTALPKHGKLIVVEIHVTRSLKYLFTWFTDNFLVAWFFEKKFHTQILFRKKEEWQHLFKQIGFRSSYQLSEKQGPFANIIFTCVK